MSSCRATNAKALDARLALAESALKWARRIRHLETCEAYAGIATELAEAYTEWHAALAAYDAGRDVQLCCTGSQSETDTEGGG